MKPFSNKLNISFLIIILNLCISAQCKVEFEHQKDLVYGYKDGMALVMDVYTPKSNTNGAAIIAVMAGGMQSSPQSSHWAAHDTVVISLLGAGYVVFAVAHSSQPKYNADEISRDIPRAIRFIRHNATRFNIDPMGLGIIGYSSGGQISLLAGCAPPQGEPDSRDPVERESARLQAVVAYFPGTDMLNFGQENTTILEHFHSLGYFLDAAFDFHHWDEDSNRYERIQDKAVKMEYYKRNSPITHVTKDNPPILIFHGDKDLLVPIQQSISFCNRLKEERVTYKLIVLEGRGHGRKQLNDNEIPEILAWFGTHLKDTL